MHFAFIALAALALDLSTKAWARGAFSESQQVLVPGVAWTQLKFNPHGVYGWMEGLPDTARSLAMAVLPLLLMAWLIYEGLTHRQPMARAGLALVAGGGAGNLWERFTHARGVTDFLQLGWQEPWRLLATSNLADLFVTVGCALIVVVAIRPRSTTPGR